MLKGIDEKGEMRNLKVDENGALKVLIDENESKLETTLVASVITVGTVSQNIEVGKKVTQLNIANYSDTADLTLTINEKDYTIGSNLTVDLLINRTVDRISIVSTEDNTKIQYIIKGVE